MQHHWPLEDGTKMVWAVLYCTVVWPLEYSEWLWCYLNCYSSFVLSNHKTCMAVPMCMLESSFEFSQSLEHPYRDHYRACNIGIESLSGLVFSSFTWSQAKGKRLGSWREKGRDTMRYNQTEHKIACEYWTFMEHLAKHSSNCITITKSF